MATAFGRKKIAILQQLSVPSESYDDLSPKGSVDEEIRGLVDSLNSYEGLVTTSSCSGRISIFLEGRSKDVEDVRKHEMDDTGVKSAFASVGGKGGGGRWLFVSHAPLDESSGLQNRAQSLLALFQLQQPPQGSSTRPSAENVSQQRFVHFKFEPMILHILAANSATAQRALTAALQSGFRESGAMNLSASGPSSQLQTTDGASSSAVAIAVRTTGLAFDNIIGLANNTDDDEILTALVTESYLHTLVRIANRKFTINKNRMDRFQTALAKKFGSHESLGGDMDEEWEDAAARKARKRAEGLRRRDELNEQSNNTLNQIQRKADAEGLNLGLLPD